MARGETGDRDDDCITYERLECGINEDAIAAVMTTSISTSPLHSGVSGCDKNVRLVREGETLFHPVSNRPRPSGELGERVSLWTEEGGKGEYSSGRVGRRLMFQKLLSV